MRRALFFLVLLAFAAANIVAGLLYRQKLEQARDQTEQAAARSPQTRLGERRAELGALQQAVGNWQRRAGRSLGEAIQLFDTAAVGWDEILLESSAESVSRARLDVLTVRGLAGDREQLSRVDKRLAPRCSDYRRSPTRDGKFILSCQARAR